MTQLRRKGAWLAAAALVALALPLAGAHHADAQATQTDASCPPPATAALTPQQVQTQVQQEQTTFAQDLAQALNLPVATVQQAINAQNANAQSSAALPAPPRDPIAAAAQQLGVTADQLATAVKAADATLPCNPATQLPDRAGGQIATGFIIGFGRANGASGGPPAIDTSAFYASVAQSLGGSFTGAQVEAAFQSTAPVPPDASQLQSRIQTNLSSLAAALGVSSSTLTAALQSLGSSGACLPPGVLGGEVMFHTAASATPPSYDSGPIFVPIVKQGGTNVALSPLDQLGIKPCGPVAIRTDSTG